MYGSRQFVVTVGNATFRFADSAFGTEQMRFERRLNVEIFKELKRFSIHISNYSDMGIPLSMFKQEGVPLSESISEMRQRSAKEPKGVMDCEDFLKRPPGTSRPAILKNVGAERRTHLTRMGYRVVGGNASLPEGDYKAAIDRCLSAIVSLVDDPEVEFDNMAILEERVRNPDVELAKERQRILGIIDKAYSIESGACTEQDLTAFMELDANHNVVMIEASQYRLTKLVARRTFMKVQFRCPTMVQYVSECLSKVANLGVGVRELLWFLHARRPVYIFSGNEVGPKDLRDCSSPPCIIDYAFQRPSNVRDPWGAFPIPQVEIPEEHEAK